ncbi:MAG TPA: tyrosine-type recombinase/integrase [Limnochordales bacterium]
MDAAGLLEQLEAYWLFERHFKPSTAKAYRREVDAFLRWLAEQPLEAPDLLGRLRAVDERLAARYIAAEQKRHGKTGGGERVPAFLHRKIYALRSLYDGLTWMGVRVRNPFARLHPPEDDRVPGYLLPSEVRRLLDAIRQGRGLTERERAYFEWTGPRDLAIVTLSLYQGLALRELCGLDVDDVDLEAEQLRIKGRRHLLPLHPASKDAVAAYLQKRPPAAVPALFLTVRGDRVAPRTVERVVSTWAQRAGIRANVKLLRSTFAAHLTAQTNLETDVLAELLGYRNPQHVERYRQAALELKRQALRSLTYNW